MALRGDYLTIRTTASSGSATVNDVIAETTSVNIDFSAEALETTSQDDGLNASFIQGKVSCTISGDYLVATGTTEFSELFTAMNAGTKMEVEVYETASKILDGDIVITSISLSGGNSDQLTTGSFSFQCSGNMATS